jgi:hypothetical protein
MTGGLRRFLAIALVALLVGNTALAAGAMAYGPNRDSGAQGATSGDAGPPGAVNDAAEAAQDDEGSGHVTGKKLCLFACLAMNCHAVTPAPEGPVMFTARARAEDPAVPPACRQAQLVPYPGPPRPL